MLLSIILISGISGIINIRNLNIYLLQIEDFYANRYGNIKIKIDNKYNRLFLFLLKLKLKDTEARLDAIECKSHCENFAKILFTKRGYNKISGVYVTSFYPFNFFIRSKYYKLNKQFLVYPEPKKPSEELFNILSDKKSGESIENKVFINEFIDISGLRMYTRGDPIKNINWKSFYRNENILVKKYEATYIKPLIIEVRYNIDIEQTLSFATFIVIDYFKKNIPIGLKINNVFIKPSTGLIHRNILLKKLALCDESNFTT